MSQAGFRLQRQFRRLLDNQADQLSRLAQNTGSASLSRSSDFLLSTVGAMRRSPWHDSAAGRRISAGQSSVLQCRNLLLGRQRLVAAALTIGCWMLVVRCFGCGTSRVRKLIIAIVLLTLAALLPVHRQAAPLRSILLVWADNQFNRLAVCRLDSDAPTGNTDSS